MKRMIIAAGVAAWPTAPAVAATPVESEWWHAMTSLNADRVLDHGFGVQSQRFEIARCSLGESLLQLQHMTKL